jgi:hypothetical protein
MTNLRCAKKTLPQVIIIDVEAESRILHATYQSSLVTFAEVTYKRFDVITRQRFWGTSWRSQSAGLSQFPRFAESSLT